MDIGYSRRAFLAGLLGTASSAALAGAPDTSLRPTARPDGLERQAAPAGQRIVDAANLGDGKVGYVVADARTGQVLETMNPLLRQPPASVTKAITTLYALDRLGAGYRFRTRLIGTGAVTNGRLNGDLVLVGGGDPTLSTDTLGDMARALKQAGVREVTGAFKVYAAALPYVHEIDRGQPDHLGYNPAVSGLNLNYNRVHFEWKRAASGYQVTMDARAERFRPAVSVARMQVVNRDLPVYTYSDAGGRDNWTVARGALGNGGSRWLPVRRPEAYAAEVFQVLARSHGIVLRQAEMVRTLPQGQVLVDNTSSELRLILRDMLRYSTNLTAEAVGLTASSVAGRAPGALTGSARQMTSWLERGFGVHRARFVDHSGLGDGSKISASEMVRTLLQAGPQGALRPILKDIRLRDSENRPLQNQRIAIKAKTGTLNFVSALAGYMRTPGGHDLVFAIFAADTGRRAAISRAMREHPEGGRAWALRARRVQQQLIERWAVVYEA